MKKLLTIVLTTTVLLACNSKSNEKGNDDSTAVTENHGDHKEKHDGLALNNGAKWKADSTTVANVTMLQAIVSKSKQESPDHYLQTASQLQEGLNKMVNECKMSGADHDALHQWLVPLMGKVKDLSKERSVENAAENLHDIEKHLALFAQYFE